MDSISLLFLIDTRNSEEYTVIAEINGHTLSRSYITGKVQATRSNSRTLKVKNTPRKRQGGETGKTTRSMPSQMGMSHEPSGDNLSFERTILIMDCWVWKGQLQRLHEPIVVLREKIYREEHKLM